MGKYRKRLSIKRCILKCAYEDEWITDSLARKMIFGIVKSVVLDGGAIDSLIMVEIAPFALSGRVKTLVLMKNERSKIFNAFICRDDCIKWILKLTEAGNFTIDLRHLMDFG